MTASTERSTDFHQLQQALAEARRVRLSGNCVAALVRLDALEKIHPKSGLLWQERALGLQARGDAAAAVEAFRRAVEFNNALPESWRALIEFSRAAADRSQLPRATAALAQLESLPPELLDASCRLGEGDIDGAEPLIRGYLRSHGAHLEGMRLLAQACIGKKNYDDAELLLEAVLDRDPRSHEAQCDLCRIFVLRQRYYPALLQAQGLLAREPGDPKIRKLYASACDGLGRFDEALRVYRELLEETPEDPELELAIAFALRAQGRPEQAVAGFQHATRLTGCAGSAYAALADMKTYRFSDAEIAALRRIETDGGSDLQRLSASFALGKALEDRKQYEEAFRCYARGNALRRAELRYDSDASERYMALRESLFTPEFFTARRGRGCPSPDPLFIVGMPRTGSTLLEQILASHPQVDGTLELPEIPRLVRQFRARDSDTSDRYAAVLVDLSAQELRRLGEIYLEETRVYRTGAPLFVDKMPSNFQEVGFIHLILPNAKIIDVRRSAMACCFSNFKQLFSNGQEFSYDLKDVGRYYRSYVRLMDHWDRVLPGTVLKVWYEDLVTDLEATVRRVLDFCGLPFEHSCLEFYKTQRSVRTVSSEQVRRPINRDGLELWRNYERWLGPLRQSLGPLADDDAGTASVCGGSGA